MLLKQTLMVALFGASALSIPVPQEGNTVAKRDIDSADITKRSSELTSLNPLMEKIRRKDVEKRDDEDAAYSIFYREKRDDGALVKKDDEDAAYSIFYREKRDDEALVKKDDEDAAYSIFYRE